MTRVIFSNSRLLNEWGSLWPYYKLKVPALSALHPTAHLSVLVHRVSNTVHSLGHAWQPGQNWPHGMVSWSHSVALSEWCSHDMWLWLADSCLRNYILCPFIPFVSLYYFKTQPDQRSSGLPSWMFKMFNLWTRLVALPVVRRHQDHQQMEQMHLRHRILLQCHCMIPSRYGTSRMSWGKGRQKHGKTLPALEPSLMRVAQRPLEASAARPVHQVWLCSIDSKRSMPGRQPQCPTHRPPTQMQQYKQRWRQECCNHPAWPREKRIYWSPPMADVTATKATLLSGSSTH